MFILTTIQSEIRVHPKDLNKPPLVAVTDVIEQQYLDKVIPELGLPVTVYDVQNIEGGHVYPNDGAAYFTTQFRLVVFRPFVGEVLVGTLTACTKDGCKVSLGFFNDVVIPDYALQNPSFFHDVEGVWYWQYGDDRLPMDPGQALRFRVSSIRFNPMPTAAQQAASTAAAAAATSCAGGSSSSAAAAAPAGPVVYSPMEILGDIDGDGLGPIEWWLPPQEGEDGDGKAAQGTGTDLEGAAT